MLDLLLISLNEGYYKYKHMKIGNTVHITKMGIKSMVVLTSLAAAITTVLIATNIVAVSEVFRLISIIVNPTGIAALFIAAIYSLY
ncbi:MAG: hypothetical protein ACR5K2_03340 [Wolbachia sp.]